VAEAEFWAIERSTGANVTLDTHRVKIVSTEPVMTFSQFQEALVV